MALPSKDVSELVRMSRKELEQYFMGHARYIPDSPPGRGYSYAIRFGSQTLYDDDTHELRIKFDRKVGNAKRRTRCPK